MQVSIMLCHNVLLTQPSNFDKEKDVLFPSVLRKIRENGATDVMSMDLTKNVSINGRLSVEDISKTFKSMKGNTYGYETHNVTDISTSIPSIINNNWFDSCDAKTQSAIKEFINDFVTHSEKISRILSSIRRGEQSWTSWLSSFYYQEQKEKPNNDDPFYVLLQLKSNDVTNTLFIYIEPLAELNHFNFGVVFNSNK